MSVFERLAAGFDLIGRKAGQALDEGKLRMDLMRERRRKDNTARELGYVVYAQSKGTAPGEGRIDVLIGSITEAETEIARLEARIQEVRARSAARGGPTDGPPAGDGSAQAPPAADAPPAGAPAPEPAAPDTADQPGA